MTSEAPASPLTANGLSVGYGDATIVKNVDLEIAAGQITALVGPNGCGKSTLLQAFARILKPKSAHVTLHGHPITSSSTRDVAPRLAILPQVPVS
ncbi:MAG: ATP-binding cassette domain-containing protein, partial [Pseudomonadota bacterium]